MSKLSEVESLRDDHQRQIEYLQGEMDRRFTDLKEQIEMSRRAMEVRLDGMNEFRATLSDTTAKMVERTLLDSTIDGMRNDYKRLDEQIESVNQNLSSAKGRQAAYATLIAVGIALISVVAFLLNAHLH